MIREIKPKFEIYEPFEGKKFILKLEFNIVTIQLHQK